MYLLVLAEQLTVLMMASSCACRSGHRRGLVAHEGARLGGMCRRRRAVAAKGVIALEGVGGDVVDVDVAARARCPRWRSR